MQLEVIIPDRLPAGGVRLVHLRHAKTRLGSFLNEYFSAAARWAASCWP
jgi:hypothetical protein